MLIQFENAVVRIQESVVLSQLSLTIEPQQHWIITGGNGAGKSTLLDVIAGKKIVSGGKFVKKGTVEFVASDYSFHRIANDASQYYQQRFEAYGMFATPTVREVLKDKMKPVGTVDEASVFLGEDTVQEQEVIAIAELLQLTHLLDAPFISLSNGETRRMLLARSLVKRPDILLLDGPFTGLDVASRSILKEALHSIAQEGVTIIMVASLADAPAFITHQIHLEQGKIAYIGPQQTMATQLNTGISTEAAVQREALIAQLGEPQDSDFLCAFDLRNITVAYGTKKVIDRLNWKVHKGEKWALTGPNGSGKSTILSILTADHPQRFANDFDLFDQKRGGKNASIWDIKKKIGHMSPELHMYFPADTTVEKTIASGFFDATGIYFKKLNETQVKRVNEVAAIMGIEHLLGRKLARISKGEQRLVLLARAIVKNPPLLILDEPCQGLDIENVEHFKQLVDTICASEQRTLIYVSHYPLEIPSCVTQYKTLESPA